MTSKTKAKPIEKKNEKIKHSYLANSITVKLYEQGRRISHWRSEIKVLLETRPGGGTSIYGLYRYVPRDRVIIFAPVNNVFPALSLNRVPKLYQLKLQCKNAWLNEKQMICEDQNIHYKY